LLADNTAICKVLPILPAWLADISRSFGRALPAFHLLKLTEVRVGGLIGDVCRCGMRKNRQGFRVEEENNHE
jgi:hypothetical protein